MLRSSITRQILVHKTLPPLPHLPHTRYILHNLHTSSMAAATEATFRYFDASTQDPSKRAWAKVDADVTSFERVTVKAPVYNAREDAEDFRDVDRTGFAFHTFPSKVATKEVLDNTPTVRSSYYDEIEQVLREKLVSGKNIKKVCRTASIHGAAPSN